MTRLDYFLSAIKANTHLRKDWVISVFAVSELGDGTTKPKYDYQLLNIEGDYGFIDPISKELLVFEDAPVTEELLSPKTIVDLPEYSLPNQPMAIKTTIGNILFNAIVLVYPFYNKFNYINKAASIRDIESAIVKRLIDDAEEIPTEDSIIQPVVGAVATTTGFIDPTQEPIYVREYKVFAEAAIALAGYATIFVPGATPRTLTPAPGYMELKKKLLHQYRNQLNDATIIAEIEKQLIALDEDWIKTDPDFGFVRTAKTMKIARKRMFYVHGIESGFSEGGQFAFIPNSLNEGWDITKLPDMVNSLRDGSFNRGAQTALGGEKTKTIFRVMSGATIESDDCGSKLGITRVVTDSTHKVYVGSTAILEDGTQVLITEESMRPYIGTKLQIRSPLYCLAGHNNFCMACIGQFMRGNENSLGVVAAACGSQLLLLFMKRMHGTILSTANYDVFTELR